MVYLNRSLAALDAGDVFQQAHGGAARPRSCHGRGAGAALRGYRDILQRLDVLDQVLPVLHADEVRVAAFRIDPEIGSNLGAGHERTNDVADDVTFVAPEQGGPGAVHVDLELGQI